MKSPNQAFNEQEPDLNRRSFLQHSLLATVVAGLTSGLPGRSAAMDCTAADMRRTLVNVMLHGGADLRYLLMPAPSHADAAYVDLVWQARRSLYDSEYENYTQMFEQEYLPAADPLGSLTFGMHRSAAWLRDQFQAGHVAIVANAYCCRNRRHDQSVLNADAGLPELDILNFDRSGWGGRLVEYLGDSSNSVELGPSVSTFNKGSIPGARLAHVVHAQNMRDMALAAPDSSNSASRRNVLARALNAYYRGRGPEAAATKPQSWPYQLFFQHHDALREFGDRIRSRLESCLALPESLNSLQLASDEFAQQCRNLYDICQVPDALNPGVLSMNYGGWDTHDNQAVEIQRNLGDIFAANGGMATVTSTIADLPYLEMPASSQLVFYFASDFGRQIVSNGSGGTDHGRGTCSILLGEQVRGGVYGELFPQAESQPDSDGVVSLQTHGADIVGLTSTDRILSVAANWVKAGAGDYVFPEAGLAGNEAGVDLSVLLPPADEA